MRDFNSEKWLNVSSTDVTVKNQKTLLQTYIDLVAEEAVYHRACYQKFHSNEGKSNQLAGLLMLIQTVHLINFVYG